MNKCSKVKSAGGPIATAVFILMFFGYINHTNFVTTWNFSLLLMCCG